MGRFWTSWACDYSKPGRTSRTAPDGVPPYSRYHSMSFLMFKSQSAATGSSSFSSSSGVHIWCHKPFYLGGDTVEGCVCLSLPAGLGASTVSIEVRPRRSCSNPTRDVLRRHVSEHYSSASQQHARMQLLLPPLAPKPHFRCVAPYGTQSIHPVMPLPFLKHSWKARRPDARVLIRWPPPVPCYYR